MQGFIEAVKRKLLRYESFQACLEMALKFQMMLTNKVNGVKENKAVFLCFGGKSYADNPKAISELLHEKDSDFEIVWLFKNPDEKHKIVPDYVRCVHAGSRQAIKELATAKFWVDNYVKPVTIYKSKKQIYIQTWHGDRGFKKVLYDSPSATKKTKYIESKICNLAISGSDYGDRKFRSAFRYSGEIMKVGCPRNDLLIENDEKKKRVIKDSLEIKAATNVLLYAPTFRREAAEGCQLINNDLDLSAVIAALEAKTHHEWICLVRAHSAVRGLDGIPLNEKKIVDVTTYEDMSDLLLITDFLITDYSSSAGDFLLRNAPVVLFQADKEAYVKYNRTFYFDPEQSPYWIAYSQKELIKLVEDMDWEKIPQYCQSILEFYGTVETGEATRYVVDYILSKTQKE